MRSISTLTIFLFLFIFIQVSTAFAQPHDIEFTHITNEDGLLNSTVHCIVQDKDGFMWFGTSGGLYHYDGYQLRVFINNPKDPNSISDNRINTLTETSDKTFYVGTWDKGLCVFNRQNETFLRYNKASKTHPIASDLVKCIIEDKKKNIWMGLDKGGLNLLDKKTKQFINYPIPNENSCLALVEDKYGVLWISTYYDGLYTFNPETKKFFHISNPMPANGNIEGWAKKLYFDNYGNLWIATRGTGLYCFNQTKNTLKHWDQKNSDLANSNISDIWPATNGYIWLATDGAGLVLLDVKNERFTHFKNDDWPESINSNAIYSLYKDKTNILWVGTFNGGINIYDPNKLKFPCYRSQGNDPTSLSNKSVLSILEDKDQNLWIGTDGGGLNLYKPSVYGEQFIHFHSDPKHPEQTAPDVVKTIFQDSFGHIWLGTWGRGIVLFDPRTKRFDYSYNNASNINGLPVWAMFEDNDNNLWISALGLGIVKMDLKTFKSKAYTPDTKCGLNNNTILCVKKDSKQRFWFGSEGNGLFLYQAQTDKFKNYANNPDKKNSISGNVIRTIYEDKKGRIWIGTLSHGLNLYNEKTGDFTNITEADGLNGNSVNSILEDKDGNLWIAGNKGITKYNPETKETRGYDRFDGLQSNDFNYNSAIVNSQGMMAFGGVSGLNIFWPEQIQHNPNIPAVYITGLSIFNKPVKMNDETGVLKQSIFETKKIILNYKQTIFTLTFSTLNYTHSQKNKYAYILQNFEKNWNYVGNKKEATYTNLDPGEYVFKVKACNNDGLWNEAGVSLKIKVLPPFLATWWFRIVVIFSLAGVVFLYFYVRINALKRQKLVLEQKVEERTSKLNESNRNLQAQKNEIMEKTEELQQLTEELLVQRDTLFSKNYKITKQNKKITDSIRYASRIQQAILPRNNVLDEAFPSNFILYIPKDIVSGDFFWFKRKENFVHLAAVDCTGHGVPGAMMSMLGVSLLNELISKEFEKPASILNELRERIKESLHQSQDIEDSSQTQDGADIAFCTINLDTLEMQYAGAYNPVYIIRNSISSLPEFIELKADKMPIGKHPKQDVDFNNKTLQLKKGDLIYLFTDGYHTQFGGPTGGKMKHAHFKEILMEIHNFPLAVQKQVLETRFLEWKDSLNQVDDILVMGVRV